VGIWVSSDSGVLLLRDRITTLFIDDGGVMNDNALRGPEWQRLVAEFFVPLLGGNPDEWKEANRAVFEKLLPYLMAGPRDQDYVTWYEDCQIWWLKEMTSKVGVAVPADDTKFRGLVWEAIAHITERVRSSYPDVAKSIRTLCKMGFKLHTASAEHSRELEGYLRGMGIRQYFNTLYGSDAVNQGKYSIEYYQRLFGHSGVAPESSLVVDDSPHNLVWAGSLGAITCLVNPSQPENAQADYVITKLADLPEILGK